MKPPNHPIFWATVAIYAIVAAATRDWIIGPFIFLGVLPVLLISQWVTRWILLRRQAGIRLRRTLMMAPAVVLAFIIFHGSNDFGGRQRQAIRLALAGQIPRGLHDVHVVEDAWGDYVVRAFFRCDPTDLRRILAEPLFRRADYPYNFFELHFSDLENPPAETNRRYFIRTDLPGKSNSGWVGTDSNFSYAYVFYAFKQNSH